MSLTEKIKKSEDSTVRANGEARSLGSSPNSVLYKLHDLRKAVILSLCSFAHNLEMLIIINYNQDMHLNQFLYLLLEFYAF